MNDRIDGQAFVQGAVEAIVEYPENVIVERSVDEKGVLLRLTVDPTDLGRVIGKRGSTAMALRTLLHTLGMRNGARYNLLITDNGVKGTNNYD